jgi:hypothetical protein
VVLPRAHCTNMITMMHLAYKQWYSHDDVP